jgi:hypothetical protein
MISVDEAGDPRELFVAEIPLDASMSETLRECERFGRVKHLKFLHPKGGAHIGRAFVDFFEASSGTACVSHSKWQTRDILPGGPDSEIYIRGNPVDVMLRNSKNEYLELSATSPLRNLHLASEGRITDDMDCACQISPHDMMKRRRIWYLRLEELKDPKTKISDVCLSVYNLPQGFQTGELRRIFTAAPILYAEKYPSDPLSSEILKHEVRITKIKPCVGLDDAAVVEFARPEHALAALREVNNNPSYFGGIRLIIEFKLVLRYSAAIRGRTSDRARIRTHSLRASEPSMRASDMIEDVPVQWLTA